MQESRSHRWVRRASSRGVTLIEASTVLAITAILATAAMPAFAAMIETRRIDGMATQLAADLHFARSEAVTRNESVRLSVHAACYVVHTGSVSDCRCTAEGTATCRAGATSIKVAGWLADEPVRVTANVASITFDPTLGTASPAGTLNVVGRSERAVRHVVSPMGRLRSCSPQPGVAGYRAC
jgi:type IV fimbrial biogenesis protein FimT